MLERYDVPLENATTHSLDALQAESVGDWTEATKSDWVSALAFSQRAVSLDPNFAMAWVGLADDYGNLGESARAAEAMHRAYDLRDRVTAQERFGIESAYQEHVTGDLEALRKIHELWAQAYPRAALGQAATLTNIYGTLGDHGKALAAAQRALKIKPGGLLYGNLAITYLNLNRLDEAMATAKEAQTHEFDSPSMHLTLYLLDFVRHDAAGMELEASGLVGKPGYGDVILYYESDTAACAGQFARARDLTRRAAESAEHADQKETAAEYEAESAVREALVGNASLARSQARAALGLARGRDLDGVAATALALAGDARQADRLAADLGTQFPKDTVAQFEYLPMIRQPRFSDSPSLPKTPTTRLEPSPAPTSWGFRPSR